MFDMPTFTVNSPTSSLVRTVYTKLTSSASGIIASQVPQISKSSTKCQKDDLRRENNLTACKNSLIRPLDITGLSRRYTFPTCHSFDWVFVPPIIAKYLASGTVWSYRRASSSPPWSIRSNISFASSPYLSVRMSFRSKTGVSRQAPPNVVKQSLTIRSTCSRQNISPGP